MDMNLLRTIELFRNLDPVQLAHLASIAEEHELPRNTVLFEEGDEASDLFVVQKGKIRISKMVPGIGEEAMVILDEGAYFGELEFIEPELNRAAHAIAHTSVTLLGFPYKELHSVMAADGNLAIAFLWSMLRTTSRRLRATNDKVSALFALSKF